MVAGPNSHMRNVATATRDNRAPPDSGLRSGAALWVEQTNGAAYGGKLGPLPSDDLIRFDRLLTDDQRLVRDSAREFVERHARPLIRACWRDGRFPVELIPEMARLGFLGASLEGYGCAALDPVEYGLVMQELERCDSGLRSFVSVQSSLTMYAVWRYGSDAQKDRWLPAMQKGEAVGCFGLTEPGFGSNPGGMLARARRDGSDWLLSGEKTWITNGSIADVAVVWAKLDDSDVIGGFLVERGAPGFTTSDLHGKLSMRASLTSSLSFVDVRLPADARLPLAEGLKAPLTCLNEARFGIGWGVVGAAQECFQVARDYTLQRKQFGGKPIASHQLVQQDLAWMATEIAKAQLLAMHCARLKADSKLDHVQVSMLKRNNVAVALETARRARDLLGANGITDEYSPFRHMANLETVKTYEGTENIHTLALGAAITGLPAFE